MGYYSPINNNNKRQEILLETTAWMNLKDHEQKKPDIETAHSAWFHLLKFKNEQSLDDTIQNSGCPRGMGTDRVGTERIIRELGGG